MFKKSLLLSTQTKEEIKVAKVVAGDSATFFITDTGVLYGSGSNGYGQLGLGDTESRKLFTKLAENVKDVKPVGNTTWYLTNDDDLYVAGRNIGHVGIEGLENVISFYKCASNVKSFGSRYLGTKSSGGDYYYMYASWYITHDGKLYSCGANGNNQHGTGTASDAIHTFGLRAQDVASATFTDSVGLFLTNGGELYGCGNNFWGPLGLGEDRREVVNFTKIASGVKSFASEGYTTFYLTSSGELFGTGYNGSGQLGIGSKTEQYSFISVARNVAKFHFKGNSYSGTTLYLSTSNELYGAGENSSGVIDDSLSDVTSFVKIASNVKKFETTVDFYGRSVSSIAWLDVENNLYLRGGAQPIGGSWTDTSNGTIYVGGNVNKFQISRASLAYIDYANNLYALGENDVGQVGVGSRVPITEPKFVLANAVYLASSDQTTWCIDSENKLYGCGSGGQGSGYPGECLTMTLRSHAENYAPNLTLYGPAYISDPDIIGDINYIHMGTTVPCPVKVYKDGQLLLDNSVEGFDRETITFNRLDQISVEPEVMGSGEILIINKGISVETTPGTPDRPYPINMWMTEDLRIIAMMRAPCFSADTEILMADGSIKLAKDIKVGDMVKVWDFDNGCYAEASLFWVKKAERCLGYQRITTNTGRVFKQVHNHRMFSLTNNTFEQCQSILGHKVWTVDGEETVVSAEFVREPVEYYNAVSHYHMNLICNGFLTSCRFNNLYPIKDMKFIKEERPVRKREEFDVPDSWFYGVRLSETTKSVKEVEEYVRSHEAASA